MKENKIPLKLAKIGLVGDSSVGKYSIYRSYAGYEFSDEYLYKNIYDKFENKFISDNGEELKLFIWTISSQERFRSIGINMIKAVTGIVIVADLTNKESFVNIKVWLQIIKENFNNPYIVLFGNKADLKDKWQITSEEAKKYAEENGLIYFETSAKTKQGIKEGISYVAKQAYKIAEERFNNRKKNIIIGKDSRNVNKSKCSSSK